MTRLLLPLLILALTRAQPIDDCPSQCQCSDTEFMCRHAQLTSVPQLMQTSIELVDLRNNSLREITRDTFDIYASMQILLLSSNRIERIDDEAFKSNSALMKLDLAYNDVDRLFEETFTGLTSLVSLNLTRNKIVEVFRSLKLDRLKELHLGFNRLEQVPSDAFFGVHNLRILDLQSNSIGLIHPKAFEPLRHLRFLILKNNPLRISASNLLLGKNAWLHVLDMTNCKIEKELSGLPKRLRDVRLSSNNLTNITSMFKSAMYVDLIILNDNGLVYIDAGALSDLPYLREVWLNRNRLETIPQLPRHLRAVHMDDNRIQTVDHNSFRVTPFVEIISLQNNQIKRLPSESFRNLRLRMIDVSMNEIAVLQRYTFSNLPVLYSVDLSRNPIQRLDTHSFDNVTNLHWLQLARTKVDMVEVESLEMLTMMKKLQYLDLSSSPGVANKLIDSGVVLNEVRTLNLMFNDMKTLPETFPTQIPNIRLLHLSGNKWHCNSSLAWLSDFIEENEKLFFAKDHTVCYTPLKWRGKAIHTLTPDEMKKVQGPPKDDVGKCPECKEPCGNPQGQPEGTDEGPEIIEDGAAIEEGSDFGPEPSELRQSDQNRNKVERFKGKILMTTESPEVETAAHDVTGRPGTDGVTVHAVAAPVDPQLESASQTENSNRSHALQIESAVESVLVESGTQLVNDTGKGDTLDEPKTEIKNDTETVKVYDESVKSNLSKPDNTNDDNAKPLEGDVEYEDASVTKVLEADGTPGSSPSSSREGSTSTVEKNNELRRLAIHTERASDEEKYTNTTAAAEDNLVDETKDSAKADLVNGVSVEIDVTKPSAAEKSALTANKTRPAEIEVEFKDEKRKNVTYGTLENAVDQVENTSKTTAVPDEDRVPSDTAVATADVKTTSDPEVKTTKDYTLATNKTFQGLELTTLNNQSSLTHKPHQVSSFERLPKNGVEEFIESVSTQAPISKPVDKSSVPVKNLAVDVSLTGNSEQADVSSSRVSATGAPSQDKFEIETPVGSVDQSVTKYTNDPTEAGDLAATTPAATADLTSQTPEDGVAEVNSEASPSTENANVRKQLQKDEEIWQMMARMFKF